VVTRAFVTAGARVAATYHGKHDAKNLATQFKSVLLLGVDVTKEEDVQELFRRVSEDFGGIDVLINLVGGFLPSRPISETILSDWEFMMSLNLRSVFLCSREFLRVNLGKPYGRIISISAMPAIHPSAGRGPYAVSKSGVVVLTKVLGDELKGSGVTANAIAPSIIRTKDNMDSMPNEDITKWVTPEEIAATMLFLCSEDARSINGLTISMFGGV
jgi:NAD(P)-dependent dehydrogenase (short-subunit alcohol dehydrogenase family)